MLVQIRPGKASDLPQVLALNQQSLPAVNSLTMVKLEFMLANSACFYVAELNQQFAGFVLTFAPTADYDSENLKWFNQHHQDFLYLDRVAVAAQAKRRGCGEALYDSVDSYCNDKTISKIALEVNIKPLNQASLDFHKKMGFKEVGQQETSGGSKRVSLMMKTIT